MSNTGYAGLYQYLTETLMRIYVVNLRDFIEPGNSPTNGIVFSFSPSPSRHSSLLVDAS